MIRTAILTVLAALVVAAPAGADPGDLTDEQRLATYLPIAEAAWNLKPCHYDVTVSLHVATLPDGWIAQEVACHVELGTSLEGLSDSQWCKTLVHEFGHAAGLPHSDDPNSIMNHTAPYRDVPYAPCDRPGPVRQPTMMEFAEKAVSKQLRSPLYVWQISCHALRGAQARGRWGLCFASSEQARYKRRYVIYADTPTSARAVGAIVSAR
jgi:Matrixin